MPAVQTPQGVVSNLAAFNMLTRRNRRMLQPITGVTGFGQTYHADLLQTGYLQSLDIFVEGTVDVTAQNAATANIVSPYFPWNIVNQLRLSSNEGLEIYRTRGYTNHVINQLRRGGVTPPQPLRLANTAAGSNYVGLGGSLPGSLLNAYAGPNGNAVPMEEAKITAVGTSGVGSGKLLGPFASWTPGTATNSTISFSLWYHIPVSVDPKLTTGAILLQNQATRLGLDITMLNANDWFLGTSGVNYTAMTNLSATIKVRQNFFSVPADASAQPDTSFVHRWIEDQQPWTAGGDNQIQVPVNGVELRLLAELQINAAASQTGNIVNYSASDGAGYQPAIFWPTANLASASGNLGNVQVSYAGSQYPEVYPPEFMMAEVFQNYGTVLPDGFLLWDFDLGGGYPEAGFNGRDVYDTSSLTQFALWFNWASTTAPPNGSRVWYARQELQRRS